ncbi:LytTR family DNA-binding domain-containing protein [Maribacter sp. IgM3_T14_3]|uniref:LytTR family DNA-binding domain-containing protein n=1 Tax=Maribacter sp. IgM3_T14_3 TaxID=3415140 RepID=UPI003C6F1E31
MRWSNYSKLFKKEYPLDTNSYHQLFLALGFGLWVFFFLWISDAFELYQLPIIEKLKRLLLYASMGALSYLLALIYQYRTTKERKRWTLQNELQLILIACGFAAVLVYTVFIYFGNENLEKLYFSNYLFTVYLPSLVIILPFLTMGRWLLGILILPKKKEPNENTIIIKAGNYQQSIELNLKELLYLKAAGNYIEVHYLEGSSLKKKIFRAKLLDVETKVPQLYRTHRSYIINPYFFKGFIREKTNLFVDLGFETKIPVARNIKVKAQKDLPFKTKK